MAKSGWQYFANPNRFMALADRLQIYLILLTFIMLAAGFYWSLFDSPADYQQGESVRIMYIHVPAAYLALMAYGMMAVASGFYVIFRHPFADLAARAAAPIGAVFCFIALVTGSLWGKPMWGTWWVWDARLTSMLFQFFLYIGYLVLAHSFEKPNQAALPCALLALFGSINLPIIKFSVEWWNTLHQPASLLKAGGPSLDASMLTPLLTMMAGFTLLYLLLWLQSIRLLLAEVKLRQLRYRLASGEQV